MRVGRGGKELAAGLEVLDDEGVGVFYEHAGPGGHRVDKAALGVDQLHKGQVVLAAHARVVLAEGRRGVDDARAVGEGDVVVRHDVPAALAGLAGKGVERLVLRADELGALDGPQHLRPLAHDLLAQGLGQDVGLAVLFGVDVVLVLVYDQRDVGGQGPGRGGPGQKEGVLLTADAELDVDARLGDVLIALGDLVGGQRRAAARAVGHDLVALVEQALVRDGLQRPPDGLDVVVVVGDVGMLHVRPVADAVAHLLPLGLVLPDGLLALLDEGLDAVAFDLGLAVDAQGLFDLQLHGQAVGVPAGLARDLEALHGLIARDQILDGARLHMADVGAAVGRGRAVEEREHRRALALGRGLFHDAVRAPELQDLLLALDEVQRRGYLVVHERHSSLRHKKEKLRPEFLRDGVIFRVTTRVGEETPARSVRHKPCRFPVSGEARPALQYREGCSEAMAKGSARRGAFTLPRSLLRAHGVPRALFIAISCIIAEFFPLVKCKCVKSNARQHSPMEAWPSGIPARSAACAAPSCAGSRM